MKANPELLLQKLPRFKDKTALIIDDQSSNDIVEIILEAHDVYMPDYDTIYQYFDKKNVKDTAKELYDFCKQYLRYNKESGSMQTVKSPAAILQPGTKIDCKHYASFIGGVLDAIKRNDNKKLDWFYRFASYDSNPSVSHVFIVALDDRGNEIWIDPIPEIRYFDEKRRPTYIEDTEPMAVYSISGIPNNGQPAAKTVIADPQASFLATVTNITHNFFNMKDLLRDNKSITYSAVKKYCQDNGFDFSLIEAAIS